MSPITLDGQFRKQWENYTDDEIRAKIQRLEATACPPGTPQHVEAAIAILEDILKTRARANS